MNSHRLTALFEAHAERRLTQAERAELEQALQTSAEARRLFWEHASIHGLLSEAAKLKWDSRPVATVPPPSVSRWIWIGALAVAAALVLLANFSTFRKPPAAALVAAAMTGPAEVIDVHGPVTIARSGVESLATNHTVLAAGDVVRVADAAGGILRYADGTQLRLDGGASLRLDGADLKDIRLEAGRLWANVAKQPAGKHVELQTALARVTVHGTEFVLDAETQATRVDVAEGLVRVAHAQRDSAMELAGGEFVVAMANRDLVGGLKPVAPAARSAWPADRDPALRPFRPDSPWNRTIRTGALYAAVQSEAFDFARNGAAVLPARLDRTLIVARPTDPEIAVGMLYQSQELVRLRGAAAAFRAVRPGGSCVVIDPERGFAHELQRVALENGQVRAVHCVSNDLRGSGLPPENVGTSFSGLPLVAGLIREGELQQGIDHALAATVLHAGLSRDGGAFVWPARHTPIEEKMIARMGATGNVHYGTLLALPAELDLATLGVGTSGPAYEIAKALQRHGAYVTHSYGPAPNPGWRQPHIQFYADGVADDTLRALGGEVAKLAPYLRVVANNQP